jgi:hypothetical protein
LVEKPDLSSVQNNVPSTGVDVVKQDSLNANPEDKSTVEEISPATNEVVKTNQELNKSDNLNLTINVKTEKSETSPKSTPKDSIEETIEEVDKILEQLKKSSNEQSTNLDDDEIMKPSLSFNNNDSILDMGTNKQTIISAPKTIERLEKISDMRYAKRKEEEEEYDDEDDERLIITNKPVINGLDFIDLDNSKLDLGDIEILK